uniref:Translocator protein n=1 Tax=Lygus hesperus TaxID=30085 RepID=A0A0A9YIG3_LYGHE
MDTAQEEVFGSVQSIVSQALKAMPATFLPIYGFWATTLPYMKKYASWYRSTSKPSSLEELADTGLLRGLIKTDKQIVELTSEIRFLERKLDGYRTMKKGIEIGERRSRPLTPTGVRRIRDESPAQEEKQKQKLLDVLKAKKDKLARATAQAQDVSNSIMSCRYETVENQEEGRPEEFTLPKIYWIMTATNVGVGLASYLVWEGAGGFEEASLPLTLYAAQLALYWTYYPVLFHFGSYEWSLIHISLATLASVITTIQFTKVSDSAGLLMMPYLFYMAYSVHHNYTVGVEECNRRQMTHKVAQLLRRYSTDSAH